MGKPTGFIELGREPPKRRPIKARIKDFREFYRPWPEPQIRAQAGRGMAGAVPFCHPGCPLGNLIPDWNDLVYRDLLGLDAQALQDLSQRGVI